MESPENNKKQKSIVGKLLAVLILSISFGGVLLAFGFRSKSPLLYNLLSFVSQGGPDSGVKQDAPPIKQSSPKLHMVGRLENRQLILDLAVSIDGAEPIREFAIEHLTVGGIPHKFDEAARLSTVSKEKPGEISLPLSSLAERSGEDVDVELRYSWVNPDNTVGSSSSQQKLRVP